MCKRVREFSVIIHNFNDAGGLGHEYRALSLSIMEPLGDVMSGRLPGKSRSTQSWSTPLRFLIATLIVVLGGTTVVLARNLSPNGTTDVNSTLGTASLITCSNKPVLTVIPVIVAGVERVGEISIDNIPIECAGKSLVIEFLSEDDEVLDRVVWSLTLVSLTDTSISARANGVVVSSANSSSSNVSLNYPFVETGSRGLDAASLSPASIARFKISSSESVVTE
jgi:hypothetical protein